jgi:hypothetical protein
LPPNGSVSMFAGGSPILGSWGVRTPQRAVNCATVMHSPVFVGEALAYKYEGGLPHF